MTGAMTSTDPDVELAHDCVTQTLHGPLPLHTSMRLAEAVLRLGAEVETYKRAKQENDDRFMRERDEARAEVKTLENRLRIASEHLKTLELRDAWRDATPVPEDDKP